VTGGGEKIVFEFGEIFRGFGDDEGGIVCVGLVPVMATLDDVSGAAAAPITAAMGHEDLAVLIIIKAPLVAAAIGEDLEGAANGMIAPDARTQLRSFVIGCARLADARVIEDTLVTVEPTIWTS